jgi:hypothetical protein
MRLSAVNRATGKVDVKKYSEARNSLMSTHLSLLRHSMI